MMMSPGRMTPSFMLLLLVVMGWPIAVTALLAPAPVGNSCFNGVGDLLQYATTGAAAGASRSLSRGLSFPFDTIKTLAQADTQEERPIQDSSNNDNIALKQYFRGVLPIVIGAIPAQASFFTTYHILELWSDCLIAQQWQPSPVDVIGTGVSIEDIKFIQRLIIASVATLPANLFKIPVEIWKQDCQLADVNLSFLDFVRGATDEARKESINTGRTTLTPAVRSSSGLEGMYRGGVSMLLREIPYTALQFSFYGKLSDSGFFSLEDNGALWTDLLHQSSAAHAALVGCVSAGLAAIATQPADVIKTRMMTSAFALRSRRKMGRTTGDESDEYHDEQQRSSSSIVASVRDLYNKRGLAGFYTGLSARLALTTIGGFVFFGVSTMIGSAFPTGTKL